MIHKSIVDEAGTGETDTAAGKTITYKKMIPERMRKGLRLQMKKIHIPHTGRKSWGPSYHILRPALGY